MRPGTMQAIYYVYGQLGPDGLEYIVRALHPGKEPPRPATDLSVHGSMQEAEQAIAGLRSEGSI